MKTCFHKYLVFVMPYDEETFKKTYKNGKVSYFDTNQRVLREYQKEYRKNLTEEQLEKRREYQKNYQKLNKEKITLQRSLRY